MAEWMVAKNDGSGLVLGAIGTLWIWTAPTSESARRYSREDAEALIEMLPWRMRKYVAREPIPATECHTESGKNG